MVSMTDQAKTIAGHKADTAIDKINQHFWKSLEDVNKNGLMSVEQKIDFVIGLLFMSEDIDALRLGRKMTEVNSENNTGNIERHFENYMKGHDPEDIDMMIHELESKARTLLSHCQNAEEKTNIMHKFGNMYTRLNNS